MVDPDRRRAAIIGAGPKALFALEALLARLTSRADAPRWAITVIDPGSHPGTGAAYQLEQPEFLRLNVSAAILDAPVSRTFPGFPDWVGTHRPDLAGEVYPPRAVIGGYLTARWRALVAALGEVADLQPVAARAVAVRPHGRRWLVECEPRLPRDEFDEVLVATGHGRHHEGELARSWSSVVPLRPAVLPVATMLSPSSVPAGSRAVVRGAALTFLDAALALTEGRGATFVPAPGRPGVLLHQRGPGEPATLLPTSRQGILLDAKPDPGTPAAEVDAAVIAGAAQRLEDLDRRDPLLAERLLAEITSAAALLLGGPEDHPEVQATLRSGAAPDARRGAEQALRRSVDVALGHRAPGAAWALGRAWSRLYPQVTAALRGSDMSSQQWAVLQRASRTLERFAFGPPLVTAQKLLAMIDSGAVDLSWLDAGVSPTPAGALPSASGADVVIDAVLAPPGLVTLLDPLPRQLLEERIVAVRPGRRGAMVDADGTALDVSGRRREHLALIGRPTEDDVIGHDTLNRHLHHEIENWAARVAATAAEEGPCDRGRPE